MEHKTFPCEQHQAIFPTCIRIHFDYRLWSKEKFASPASNIRGGNKGIKEDVGEEARGRRRGEEDELATELTAKVRRRR